MTIQSIISLLENAAQDKGILFYPHGSQQVQELKYHQLRSIAKANSRIIRSIDGVHEGSIILLHFEDHVDNIVWLWSVLYAGCIPAMSIALPKNANDCGAYLNHLHGLLEDPICLTRSGLLSQFSETKLRTMEIESLKPNGDHGEISRPQQIALLMLSSGSTGHSKAVCLTHQQILASVSGKSAVLPVDMNTSFLNWIRLDHVGSLVEIHLNALYLSSNQVHVQAEDIIPNPGWFLELLHRHNVGRTFAPNFFLEDLLAFLELSPPEPDAIHLNHLRYLVSGGEANSTQTCCRLSTLLTRYGAPPNAIVPGFGMTETCAGCIYNKQCPEYDIHQQNDFVSLGECIPGIEMRITSPGDEERTVGRQVIGNLQLRGDIVFSSYFNNEATTSDAFVSDGWFKTGDVGIIDATGKLNLVGRTKDVITINGLKYHPSRIEAAIEDAEIDGIRPGCVSCFAYRSAGATEAIYVVYLPAYSWDDAEARYNTRNSIIQRVLLLTNSLPYILPLDPNIVERTMMGKISRSKLSAALQNSQFQKYEAVNALKLEEAEAEKYSPPATETEKIILAEWADIAGIPEKALGVERNMFEAGLTSVKLIRFQQCLRRRFSLGEKISILTIMTNQTVRGLANALRIHSDSYTPVVTLQPHGDKTPLLLIHPAAGEALVFLEFSKYITQRPVYGLRARGFYPGESRFGSLQECITTYYTAIKKQQPRGPYAIAGYSYGGMLAFELAKVFEQHGDEVRFLASVNRPPHVHPNLQKVQWTTCLTHLAYFLGLISEHKFHVLIQELKDASHSEAISRIINAASPSRLDELSLDASKLETWVDVTLGLQDIARQYQPNGMIQQMDVFYGEPLAVVDCDKREWLRRLQRWQEFVGSEIRYHEAYGHHHDLFGEENVYTLQKSFRRAMEERGI